MPIYEYECSKCGHQTEALQRFSDPPITKCEVCRGKMKKLISQSTFHLKGSGWYVTDYASKSGPGHEAKPSAKEEAKDTAPKAETKSKKAEAKGSTGSSEKKET